MTLFGFDVNHWKGKQSGSIFVDKGAQFLIAKATQGEGETYNDDTFDWYHAEAQQFGLPFGGFHYWEIDADPEKQALNFKQVAGGKVGRPFVDIEKTGNYPILSQGEAAARAHACLQAFASVWGKKPGLYSNKYSIKDMLGDPSWVGDYDPIWVSSYTGASQPVMPNPSKTWKLWQYTKSFLINGKFYDANRFDGDLPELLAFLGWEAAPPVPPPATDPIGIFTVSSSYRNLRSEIGTAKPPIGKATHGSVLPYFAEVGDWKQLGAGLWVWKAPGE